MSDKLGSLEDKRKKLEELKRRKKAIEEKHKQNKEKDSPAKSGYDSPLKSMDSGDGGYGTSKFAAMQDTKPEVKGPKIDISDHLNIVRVHGKGKPLMYDQQINVTAQNQRDYAEMEAEEKQPVYDYGDTGDQHDDPDKHDGEKEETYNVKQMAMEDVKKIVLECKVQKVYVGR